MPDRSKAQPAWLYRLQMPQRIDEAESLPARFVYALRLMAAFRAARRDPVAELAVRLESVTTAICAIELSQALIGAWPEPIVVNRFCCQVLSHDEATIAALVTAAAARNQADFAAQLSGLVRPDRIERLWAKSVLLAGAETATR